MLKRDGKSVFPRHKAYTKPLCGIQESPRKNSTFGFCQHKSQRRKNQKSCFLPTLKKKNKMRETVKKEIQIKTKKKK